MKYPNYIILNTFLIIFLLLCTLSYLFKAKLLIVTSNSMAPAINKGDLIVAIKSNQYEVGDIISFKHEGLIATHRITNIEQSDFNQNTKITTKGDANKSTDSRIIEVNYVIGKVVFIIAFLGFIFLFFQSSYFIYLLLIIILILLIEKIKNDKY